MTEVAMSNSTTPSSNERAKASRRGAAQWLREPLLHFVLLGGLLFAVDHMIYGRVDDPRTIEIDGVVDAEAREVFKNARGHEPDEDELYGLRRVWLDNEVLYGDVLALLLEQCDGAIGDRAIVQAVTII